MKVTVLFLCYLTALFSQERAYIGGLSDEVLFVFNLATNTVIDTVSIPGASTTGLAVSFDGTKTYLANTDNFYVINNLANVVVKTISTGTPTGVAISPNEAQVYVTNNGSDNVNVIDTSTNTVVNTIPVGVTPLEVVFHPDGTKAYTANQTSETISVIDTALGSVIATIPLSIASPADLAISPDGRTLYATGTNGLSVIDTATNAETDTVLGIGASDVVITPDGSRLYISDSSGASVEVVDTSTNMVIQSISVAPNPFSVAINFDGAKVYVIHIFNSNITVIDTSTNLVAETIPLGFLPSVMAFGEFLGATAEPKVNVTLTQKELFNEIAWTRPTQVTPVNYFIYRSAGFNDLIGVVSSAELKFEDHNRSKRETNSYFIAAEDQFGNQFLIGTTASVSN